ncbi:unnamed protein product [Symbiodinium sp. CCMP2456]|nr:unnamed protein product [Symbiodinium sp. CCMP2456]
MPSDWQRWKRSMPQLRQANSMQARTKAATQALQQHAPIGIATAARRRNGDVPWAMRMPRSTAGPASRPAGLLAARKII